MCERGTDLHVPALADVEVTAALRRGLHTGAVTADRATNALDDYADLPLLTADAALAKAVRTHRLAPTLPGGFPDH